MDYHCNNVLLWEIFLEIKRYVGINYRKIDFKLEKKGY